ncbi:superoxide dismutase 2 [Arctopsyche grandis]|uniref:superoxide dismutase 2 n=1 Tax=Arctopsyche grandis TaxID=121162 RepID=UPI00406D81AF
MFAGRRAAAVALNGALKSSNSRAKHTLPDLSYEYKALEPVISGDIMALHHSKHHATYIANLNAAEEKLVTAQSKGDVSGIISLEPAIRFNGGGHINHTIFWQNLSPNGGAPSKELLAAIERDFGSLEKMKDALATRSIAVQGSGWGWLGLNKESKRLQIATCSNQDPLEATTGLVPLFGIDVWEHAYYLQYKNVRADYVKRIFDVANWNDVSARFAKAQ